MIAIKKNITKSNNVSLDLEFMWGHTTESMGIGYYSTTDSSPKVFMSYLSEETSKQAGRCVKFSSKVNLIDL